MKKTKLSIKDIKRLSVGESRTWRLESGAAIITARSLLVYLKNHDGLTFKSSADFSTNSIEITRLS